MHLRKKTSKDRKVNNQKDRIPDNTRENNEKKNLEKSMKINV